MGFIVVAFDDVVGTSDDGEGLEDSESQVRQDQMVHFELRVLEHFLFLSYLVLV